MECKPHIMYCYSLLLTHHRILQREGNTVYILLPDSPRVSTEVHMDGWRILRLYGAPNE
jgi:hypothetical protein